jgi:hypothetical protein
MSSGLEPRIIYPILNEIQRWVKSSGEEWTISRLKTLKQSYINLLSGSAPVFPQDSWWKHDGVLPKGPWRRIFLLRKPQKALSALMVYTSWISPKVTESQKEKFYSAVSHEFDVNPMVYKVLSDFADRFSTDNLLVNSNMKFVSVQALVAKDKRCPNFIEDTYGISESDNVLRTEPVSLDALVNSLQHPLLQSWFYKNQERLPDDGLAILTAHAFQGVDGELEDIGPNLAVGVISHIQEPGFKLRAVANPLLGFQYALSSMGNHLYSCLSRIESDCTFDQDKGVRDAQAYMRSGGRLMSIDLSNATDLFPFEITEMLLKKMEMNPSDISLFKEVSRGQWQDKLFGKVSWKTGQPLGVYPSFGAFALSHHLVAQSVTPDFYRILGDDIVIDRGAGLRLKNAYTALGVSVSESKSMDSAIMAEFGGRLITRSSVFVQPKWKKISDRSFFDLARNLGPSVVPLLQPRQRKVVEMFSEVPTDLHPYGLGWNPKGKTYADRVAESQPLLDLLEIKLEKGSSITVRSLDDLRLSIELSSYIDGYLLLDITSQRNDPQFADLSERVLQNVGVTHADFDTFLPSTFEIDSKSYSDPRGITTLESLESKYGHTAPVRSR